MAVGIKYTLRPTGEVLEVLRSMGQPGLNHALTKALIACAILVSNEITERQIIRGGRVNVGGPRGGKHLVNTKPHATKLTSRSGAGGLRESLGTSYGIDKSHVPRFIDVGTDIVYGAIHEYGGTIRVTPRMRNALHYEGIHLRKSTHTITIPPRPFLKPGFEAVEPRFPDVFVKYWKQEIGV